MHEAAVIRSYQVEKVFGCSFWQKYCCVVIIISFESRHNRRREPLTTHCNSTMNAFRRHSNSSNQATDVAAIDAALVSFYRILLQISFVLAHPISVRGGMFARGHLQTQNVKHGSLERGHRGGCNHPCFVMNKSWSTSTTSA